MFGAYDLMRESIANLPKATKILLDALTIIKPLAKNELSLAAVISGYFKNKRWYYCNAFISVCILKAAFVIK